jgi:hypothetical protein
MNAPGPIALVVLVHFHAGILNSVVTLTAPFTVNTHPPNVVLVAFARTLANDMDAPSRASPARRLLASAGTTAISASKSGITTPTVERSF